MKYAFNHQQWQPTSLGNGLPFGHELNLRINKAKNYSVQDYLIHLKWHFVIAHSIYCTQRPTIALCKYFN